MAGIVAGEGKTLKDYPVTEEVSTEDLLLAESPIEGTRVIKFGEIAKNVATQMAGTQEYQELNNGVREAIDSANQAQTEANQAINNLQQYDARLRTVEGKQEEQETTVDGMKTSMETVKTKTKNIQGSPRLNQGSAMSEDQVGTSALGLFKEDPNTVVENSGVVLYGDVQISARHSIGFGVDSNGNYGYIKEGADTVTPFLSMSRIASQNKKVFNNESIQAFYVPMAPGKLYKIYANTTDELIYVVLNSDKTLKEQVVAKSNDALKFHYYEITGNTNPMDTKNIYGVYSRLPTGGMGSRIPCIIIGPYNDWSIL